MTTVPCPATATHASVPSTIGIPIGVDHSVIEGTPLVTIYAHMREGLIDLSPHSALELAMQLIAGALGGSPFETWEGGTDGKVLSLQDTHSEATLDVCCAPLGEEGVTVCSDLGGGPMQTLEGLTPFQARALALMLLEGSFTS